MKKNRLPGAAFIAGLIAFFAMAGYLLMQGNNKPPVVAAPAATRIPGGAAPEPFIAGLIETRPIVPANNYTGRAAATYRYAAEIPQVIDSLYCYCQCKENPMFHHKTLLTCFTDDHAADCDICMKEAEMAYEMTKQGKTPKEIQAAVDQYYARR
jgi:hypothetical protein